MTVDALDALVRDLADDRQLIDDVVSAARAQFPEVARLSWAESRRHVAALMSAGFATFSHASDPEDDDFTEAVRYGAERAALGVPVAGLLSGVHAGRSRILEIAVARGRLAGLPYEVLLQALLKLDRYSIALERHVIDGYRAAERDLNHDQRDDRIRVLRRLLLDEEVNPAVDPARFGLTRAGRYHCVVSDAADPVRVRAMEQAFAQFGGVLAPVAGRLSGLTPRLPSATRLAAALQLPAPTAPPATTRPPKTTPPSGTNNPSATNQSSAPALTSARTPPVTATPPQPATATRPATRISPGAGTQPAAINRRTTLGSLPPVDQAGTAGDRAGASQPAAGSAVTTQQAVTGRLPAATGVTEQGILVVTTPAVRLEHAADAYRLGMTALAAGQVAGVTGVHSVIDLAGETALAAQPMLAGFLSESLLTNLDSGEPFHHDLVSTALAFLDRGQRLDRTASALHLHPNTVRYRLRRLRELTGFSDAGAFTVTETVRWWWALRTWLSTPR